MLPCDNFTKIIYENTLPSKEFKLFMRQPFGVRTWSDVGVQRVFFHHFLPTPWHGFPTLTKFLSQFVTSSRANSALQNDEEERVRFWNRTKMCAYSYYGIRWKIIEQNYPNLYKLSSPKLLRILAHQRRLDPDPHPSSVALSADVVHSLWQISYTSVCCPPVRSLAPAFLIRPLTNCYLSHESGSLSLSSNFQVPSSRRALLEPQRTEVEVLRHAASQPPFPNSFEFPPLKSIIKHVCPPPCPYSLGPVQDEWAGHLLEEIP